MSIIDIIKYLKPNIPSVLYLIISFTLVFFTGCKSKKKIQPDHDAIVIENVKVEVTEMKKGRERQIVEEAMKWLGTPYRYGASEKGRGTDCSGMVLVVYQDITGVKLPRNSAKQAEFCKKLKQSKVRPGDLVFFATGKDPNKISHVGIMLDSDKFIHASTSKGVVISDVTAPYYQRTFMMYGRVPQN